jgi:hypothetical protein
LGGGSTPSKLNEESPAVMAMMVTVAAELSGTYKILKRWVNSINAGRMLVPFFGHKLPARGGVVEVSRSTT